MADNRSGVSAAGPGSGAVPLMVTISATYGAGGSMVAPALAHRLDVPWLDRMVSAATAEQAGRATGSVEGLSDREEAATPGSRLFLYLARAAGANAMAPAETLVDHNEVLRERAEAEITELCSGGGVLLGRAGAVVLSRRRSSLHVRLDGPPDRRAAQAAAIEGIPIEQARRRLEETDRARTLYVRRLYRVDPTDASLYHVVLDTTVVDVERAVAMLVTAAQAVEARQPGAAGGW